jgi:hypothetical protein
MNENVSIYMEKLQKNYELVFNVSEDERESIKKEIEMCINWLPPDIKIYYR